MEGTGPSTCSVEVMGQMKLWCDRTGQRVLANN